MLLEKSGLDVLNEVDSASPAPGGGSISALVGALGVCLTRMYGHLTIHKKKFAALDEETQKRFTDSFHALTLQKEQLIAAIDKDCDAYNSVIAAYRLPKNTDEEIQVRQDAIKKASYTAIDSPYQIMKLSLQAIRLCDSLTDHGNKNAISDLACGVIFLDAAIQSAGLNVAINLASLDEEESRVWRSKMNEIIEESHKTKEIIINKIKNIL